MQKLQDKASCHNKEDLFSHLSISVSDEKMDLYDGLSDYFSDTVEFEGRQAKLDVELLQLPPILQIQLQASFYLQAVLWCPDDFHSSES